MTSSQNIAARIRASLGLAVMGAVSGCRDAPADLQEQDVGSEESDIALITTASVGGPFGTLPTTLCTIRVEEF